MDNRELATASQGTKNTDSEIGRLDVVSIGEPMYEFSQVPGKAREYLQGFGGDTMNCAIAARRQGARVAYVTRVGDDEFGRQLFRLWEAEGIDATAVRVDPERHTAVYFVSHTKDGHSFSYLRKGSAASYLHRDELPTQTLRDTQFLYSSGISQAISASAAEAVFASIDIAKRAGVQIVFDANVRPVLWPAERARFVIEKTIPLIDYFLLSLEDAEQLTGSSDPEAILGWCNDAGARISILKLGQAGSILGQGKKLTAFGGFSVDAVDATGAGDCFAGSLMARLSLGDELHSAINYSNAAAALACTGFGAIDPLPFPKNVFDLIRDQGARPATTGVN